MPKGYVLPPSPLSLPFLLTLAGHLHFICAKTDGSRVGVGGGVEGEAVNPTVKLYSIAAKPF